MSKTVTIWFENGRIRARFAYDRDFIADIKCRINSENRSWDPETKIWSFDVFVLEQLKKLCKLHFDKTIVIEQQQRTKGEDVEVIDNVSNAASIFVSCLPDQVLKKAFLEAAAILHPDKGGSNEKMTKLNSSYDIIKSQRRIRK